MNGLQNDNVVGGWSEKLQNTAVFDGDKTFLKGIEMVSSNYTRCGGFRNFEQIRRAILDNLDECIMARFEQDQNLLNSIEPFIQFTPEAKSDIRKIHSMFGTDLCHRWT